MRFLFTILIAGLTWSGVFAQVSFDASNQLIQDQKIRSTLSIGISDMNGDYKDDIVFLDRGKNLIVGYQNAPGQAFTMVGSGTILQNPAWALSLGDLDNDGVSEIFTCGINTFGNVFIASGNGHYSFSQLLYGLTFPQNSNMADIDNDGWLDLFVCDERASNDLFLNDQTGRMVYTDYIDMHTVPESDNSGNYGSEWVDFDDDRDLDLFITKCKPAITEPNDPLRLNVLFENDGSNHYSEQAEKYGLKNGAQSWTGSFGDLDNDGDLDCFVSNHDTTHVIYRNLENTYFQDVSQELIPPIWSSSIQAALRDFDNNGYVDILVTGDKDYLFWNMGAEGWRVESNLFGGQSAFTFATGDLNDDGFLDVIASYGLLNTTGNYDDVVWLNQTNDYHFLKFSFFGESSNRKGVGTKIKVYSPLGIQTRDVRVGESYGTTNSGNLHIGLGQLDRVDSLIVFWPSGTIDRYYDLAADQHFLAHEGKCLMPFMDIVPDADPVLCAGESLYLSLPESMEEYHWSTGDLTEEIRIDKAANVQVWGFDALGCARYSNILEVAYDPDETPVLQFNEGGAINCVGSTVKLSSTPANGYAWSTGEETMSILIQEPGTYTVTVTGHCREFESEATDVDFFYVDPPILVTDTVLLQAPAALDLEASGDAVYWFANPFDGEVLDSGILHTGIIDRDTAFYVANFKTHQAAVQRVGMQEHEGTPLGGATLNSGLMFNVWDHLYLETVKVITEIPGERTIELRKIDPENGSERLLISKEVFIPSGTQRLELGWSIEPGLAYILTTNADSNLVHFGQKSPGLYRANAGVSFPYAIDGLIEITTSLHGTSYYYYFFDWEVRPLSISCFSERIPLVIQMDTLTKIPAVDDVNFVFECRPNPAGEMLELVFPGNHDPLDLYIKVVDSFGLSIFESEVRGALGIDVSQWQSGIYYMILFDGEGNPVGWEKMIKME